MVSEPLNNRFILVLCLIIIRILKKVKIKKRLRLCNKKIENKGTAIIDKIDAKEEYFLTIAIINQHNMNNIPKL